MNNTKKIKNALISVFYKDGLDEIIHRLHHLGVNIYSTGGTKTFIESLNVPVIAVEDLTDFPEILGGRVKTLLPDSKFLMQQFDQYLIRQNNEKLHCRNVMKC